MISQLAQSRDFNLFIVTCMLFSVLLVPAVADAGIIGNVLNAIRPYAKVAGQIAGAVAGATLCSSFFPPLGSIAGAVGGWVIGGIVSSSASRSLSDLATVVGAGVGAVAMYSMGPIGMVGGVLVGGLLGRLAMNLVKEADNQITGGLLLSPQVRGEYSGPTSVSEAEAPVSMPVVNGAITVNSVGKTPIVTADAARVEAAYEAAYEAYVSATRNGDSNEVSKAYKSYVKARDDYKAVFGINPK